MPEYLAPGVYVEEVSFRSKSIEGVSTTTTGFIGPCRYGPTDLPPDVITGLGEFERVYGDGDQLEWDGQKFHNYLWHAVRAFFQEGGKRLYIARTYHGGRSGAQSGRASRAIGSGDNSVLISARFPGAAGRRLVRLTVRLSPSVVVQETDGPAIRGLVDNDVVLIKELLSPHQFQGHIARATSQVSSSGQRTWTFIAQSSTESTVDDLNLDPDPQRSDSIHVVTLAVTVFPPGETGSAETWDGLALDAAHVRAGARDSVFARFQPSPPNIGDARSIPIVITAGDDVETGLDVWDLLAHEKTDLLDQALNERSSDAERSIDCLLQGGSDGERPEAEDYEGKDDPNTRIKTGLKAFEDIDEISIVAAPGSTYGYENGYRTTAQTILGLVIAHAELMQYRIAVLDSGDGQSVAGVRAMRARLDSKYAAFYYPWITVLDGVTREEIQLPPSGFVAGIYARNDITRAVYKAPANEVVNLAIGLELLLNKAQQDILNPLGINCFRFFEGRGFRLWGARTVSSDPEWKYVNLRRYFAFLEHSIDKGTQWAVFEPNGELLWSNVRRTVEDFLYDQWRNGALLGDRPEKAYFVRCDRSTMTQNDLDNGRLVCLIGVAALRPAEYVIFRIGQWTADRKA